MRLRTARASAAASKSNATLAAHRQLAVATMATLSASLSTGLSTGAKKPRVVIAGGGVVGCTTAYYLAKEHGVGARAVFARRGP